MARDGVINSKGDEMKKIKILVRGGLIQDIKGIPTEHFVEIWDYDVDDKPEEEMTKDKNGDSCYVYEW